MAVREALQAGSTLSNGAVVIDVRENGSEALCVWPGSHDPYVIWAIDQQTGEPYRGRYFMTFTVAAGAWL